MNQLLRSFKQYLWQAAQRGGLRKGELQKRYDLDAFELKEVGETGSAAEIAAKALRYFCVEDGRFNNFIVGIAAVMSFLDEHMKGEKALNRRAIVYQDLKGVLDQGGQYEAILRWVESHYG